MIYVSICDDNEIVAQKMKFLICKELSLRGIEFKCNIYLKGKEFLEENEEKENELIILDIEIPDISGIKIAELLKENGRNRNIVFVTNYENLVFQSLQCFPFAFIRKRSMEIELPEMIEQFLLSQKKKKSMFVFSVGKKTIRILVEEIMYLTYWKHKIVLVTKKQEKYEFRGIMRECEDYLKNEYFFRVNSGAIVNLRYGKMLEDSYIVMEDNNKIQISREKRKECKLRFMKCWRENV